jgi:hypothetical protein
MDRNPEIVNSVGWSIFVCGDRILQHFEGYVGIELGIIVGKTM